MPSAALKPCIEAGCRNLSRGTRCPEHLKKRNSVPWKGKGTRQARGYGAYYQRARAAKMVRNPLCERCSKLGQIMMAKQVHHIDGDPRNNAEENLMSVCIPCHRALERER